MFPRKITLYDVQLLDVPQLVPYSLFTFAQSIHVIKGKPHIWNRQRNGIIKSLCLNN